MKIAIRYLLVGLSLFSSFLWTDKKIDDLEGKLKKVEGIKKVDVLNALAYAIREKSFKKAEEYCKQAVELAEKLKYKKGKADALSSSGEVYISASNYEKALVYFRDSLRIGEEIKDEKAAANSLRQIGYCNYHLDNYDRSLEFYDKSLKISKKIGDKTGIAKTLFNTGHVYWALSDFPKASGYYRESLKIYKNIGNRKGIADNLTMIGTIDYSSGNYKKALENLQNSLKIQGEIGYSLAYTPLYIGNTYAKLEDYEKALEYYLESIKIYKEHKNKDSYSQTSLSIANIYLKLQNYNQAKIFLQSALEVAKEINGEVLIQNSYKYFSELHWAKGEYQKALEYHKRYSALKDKLYIKSSEKIAEIRARYETEKREKEIEILKKNSEIKNLQLQKSKLTRTLLLIIIALSVIIMIFLYIRYRLKVNTGKAIREKNEVLKRANELKSEFLRIAAHDLKNPLTIIIGYTDLMLESCHNDPETEKRLNRISGCSSQMLRLISELLESSTIEEGKLQLKKSNFDFGRLAESVVQENLPAAKKKEQDISFTTNTECFIYADKTIVKSIMDNLVNNAIKYSPLGGDILVDVTKNGSSVLLTVRDNGPGLTEEDKAKLFGKFQRLSARPTAGEFSIGLGLSLVKEYVDLHKGEIIIESEAGEGSTFYVKLPIRD